MMEVLAQKGASAVTQVPLLLGVRVSLFLLLYSKTTHVDPLDPHTR